MKFNSKLSLFALGILSCQMFFAQELTPVPNPPIMVEAMAGDRGVFVQMMTMKRFRSVPKLGFFSVSSIVGEWDKKEVDDMMLQAHLTYEIYKGFTVNAGFHHTPMTGMRPTAGIMYSYANPTWTIVAFPRVDLASTPNLEMFALVEYKPKISEKLNFYSRAQGMYVHNPDLDMHQKSGLALRAGISYREFTVGAAFNSDWYGPLKTNINHIGGFVAVALF